VDAGRLALDRHFQAGATRNSPPRSVQPRRFISRCATAIPRSPPSSAQIAADGIEELLLFPQYPHYAMSSWETVVVRVMEEVARQAPKLP
jgi:hypothetical protein